MSVKSLLIKAAAYNQSGQLKLALKSYNKAIKVSPSNITALNGAGTVHLALGNHKDAIACFNETLKFHTDNIVALGSIGVAYQQLGVPSKALQYYESVLKLSPQNTTAHINAAILLLDSGDRKSAIVHCDKAIELQPAIAEIYTIKGNALSALGEFESSLKQHQIALQLNPNIIQSVTGLANCYIKLGDRNAAITSLKKYSNSNHPDLLIALSQLTDNNNQNSILYRIIDAINDQELSRQQKLQLCFAAGKLCDEIGDYNKAFKYYSLGNSYVNRDYSSKDDDAYILNIIQSHNTVCELPPESLSTSNDLTGANLIFLVGMPRSGTS